MGNFDKAVRKLGAIEKQENMRRNTEKRAEYFVARLMPGKNYFTPDQYRDIVNYIFPAVTDYERDKLIKAGKFNLGKILKHERIEVERVSWLTEDRLVSLQDLSDKTGIPYKTLWSRIRKLNLRKKVIGRKKLYDIDDLRERLSDIPE